MRPLLAATITSPEDLEKLDYPLIGSVKLDGVRCLIHPELGPVTRKLKSVPNKYIRDILSDRRLAYLDGELLTYHHHSVTGKRMLCNFNTVQSDIMSRSGTPKQFVFMVFDSFKNTEAEYTLRLEDTYAAHSEFLSDCEVSMPPKVEIVPPKNLSDPEEVVTFMAEALNEGYEGIMLRSPVGRYKFGRSTTREQILMKYKLFLDAEGVVEDFIELEHNNNEQELDAFGLAKRSSHKSNKAGGGTLGALVLRTDWGSLSVGTGFTLALRDAIWKNRNLYFNKVVTFKYQPFGMKTGNGLPRFPVFMHFREVDY